MSWAKVRSKKEWKVSLDHQTIKEILMDRARGFIEENYGVECQDAYIKDEDRRHLPAVVDVYLQSVSEGFEEPDQVVADVRRVFVDEPNNDVGYHKVR